MEGLIHIYCGDGKGKSTAAVGLGVRAAGCGKKVLMVRFLKNDCSGEVAILSDIPGIHLVPCKKEFGFTFNMTEQVKKEAKEYYSEVMKEVLNKACEEEYDLLIMDEIMAAYRENLIPRQELIDFLSNKPEGLEVVLTGRNPDEKLVELADYVSEMKKIKHPYEKGIPARRGIEF
jgi:ATP:corrinoid adenosyltransferase